METLWFVLLAFLLTGYVVLDGFDLGAGVLHWAVGETSGERGTVLRSIGPFWDGNEVWLIAAGGTLYFAFPTLYASSFSGFYLPLIIVLWLLMMRGVAIDVRGHLDHRLWIGFWDVVFAASSLLLALFLGAALGNVIRGAPLDAEGWFFAPLWTDFGFGDAPAGILDWYTVLVGVLAVAALTVHGALWLVLKTTGPVRERALLAASRGWWSVAALTVVVTVATISVQPRLEANLGDRPWGLVFPGLALAGIAGVRWFVSSVARVGEGQGVGFGDAGGASRVERLERGGFLASALFLAGMMASAAFGVYPYVLPASSGPGLGLTVTGAASGEYSLRTGLFWWPVAMGLTLFYFTRLYRSFAGRV